MKTYRAVQWIESLRKEKTPCSAPQRVTYLQPCNSSLSRACPAASLAPRGVDTLPRLQLRNFDLRGVEHSALRGKKSQTVKFRYVTASANFMWHCQSLVTAYRSTSVFRHITLFTMTFPNATRFVVSKCRGSAPLSYIQVPMYMSADLDQTNVASCSCFATTHRPVGDE
jgi:hypothetical protein